MFNIKPPFQADAEAQLVEPFRGDGGGSGFLRQELAIMTQPARDAVEAVASEAALADVAVDSAEFVPRLARYKANYDRLVLKFPENLKGLSWEEIASRLIANNALQLSRAEAMDGVLFGVDENNKAVFASRQKEPEMVGMNYKTSRDAVMFQADKEGKKISTGYELFHKDLIKQYEQFTDHPVVASEDGKEYRSIWLESGEDPDWAYYARFRPYFDYAYVDADVAIRGRPLRGVRRLLRV